MSGKTKRIIYTIVSGLLLAGGLVGGVLMWWFSPEQPIWIPLVALAMQVVIHPAVLLHESGHVLMGKLCGMHFVSFRVGFLLFDWSEKLRVHFRWDGGEGESAFFPERADGLRGRVIATTAGGAGLDLLAGVLLLVLYLALPYHPALMLFAFFAPLCLTEAVSALIPVELSAGKTDGEVLKGLLKRSSEEEVMLAVLHAQAVLWKEEFPSVPRAVLFDTPVVREDLPAQTALELLRMQYDLAVMDDEAAEKIYKRLSASEELPEEALGELERYGAFFRGKFFARPSRLYGVARLEEDLAARQKICPQAD